MKAMGSQIRHIANKHDLVSRFSSAGFIQDDLAREHLKAREVRTKHEKLFEGKAVLVIVGTNIPPIEA
jgi:hypothetical protein